MGIRMEKLIDISKVQDKMLKVGNEIRCLECLTNIVLQMHYYDFSQNEIEYIAYVANEKAIQVHKDYNEIEYELNI